MPLAFWRDEYRTGNTQVDKQHQQLFLIFNRLHDAMMEGHGKDVLKQTIDSLASYTLEHFKTEEELMIANEYPYYKEHKNRHNELKEKLIGLVKNFEDDTSFLTIKVSQFLTEWLIHHIKAEDQKMIKFMRGKLGVDVQGNSQPLQQIETAVLQLHHDEFRQFSEWFFTLEHQRWDEHLETEIADGNLEPLAQEAIAEFNAGQYRVL